MRAVQCLPPEPMKFALSASLDTLPTNANLYTWGKISVLSAHSKGSRSYSIVDLTSLITLGVLTMCNHRNFDMSQ